MFFNHVLLSWKTLMWLKGAIHVQTVCATQAVAQTIWSCVVWFERLCNSLTIFKQIWILSRNNQVAQQFEACMDMLASCCSTSTAPSLWYFDDLDFLRHQEIQVAGKSTMEDEPEQEDKETSPVSHCAFFIVFIQTFVFTLCLLHYMTHILLQFLCSWAAMKHIISMLFACHGTAPTSNVKTFVVFLLPNQSYSFLEYVAMQVVCGLTSSQHHWSAHCWNFWYQSHLSSKIPLLFSVCK